MLFSAIQQNKYRQLASISTEKLCSLVVQCYPRRPGRWPNCPGCRLSAWRCQQCTTWLAARRCPIWNPAHRTGTVPNKKLKKKTVEDVQCSGGADIFHLIDGFYFVG